MWTSGVPEACALRAASVSLCRSPLRTCASLVPVSALCVCPPDDVFLISAARVPGTCATPTDATRTPAIDWHPPEHLLRAMPSLDIEAVRREAGSAGLFEIYFNEASRVVSFAPDPEDPQALTRINVYYTTGTVATCMDHPRQGKTQLFRRDVDIVLLRELLRDPRLHTNTGYHRRVRPRRDPCVACLNKQPHVTLACGHTVLCSGCADQLPRNSRNLVSCPICRTESTCARDESAPESEEAAALAQVSRLRTEAAEIARQMQIAEGVLTDCRKRREEKERREAEERRRREEEERAADARRHEEARQEALRQARAERGRFCDFFLSDATHVGKILTEKVTCVSTNGCATICLYESGGWAWTSGLPKLLHNKLNGRSTSLPSPEYVAIGPNGYYYIRFADGKSEWVGPDNLETYLKGEAKEKGGVATLAFGSNDSFFIVYNNGGWRHSGDIPNGLRELLQTRDKKGDLKCVSLGSGGAYFLRAKNGRMWWGGASGKTLAKIRQVKDRIKFIDFGTYDQDEEMDDYIVRYT